MKPTIFNLAENNFSREELIDMLMPEVDVFLNKDFEKFLLLCYRIDLSEEKLKAILHRSPPENIVRDLTTAIVDRQLLKIEIKRKYS